MEAIRETGKAPGNAGEQTGTPRKKSGIPKKPEIRRIQRKAPGRRKPNIKPASMRESYGF